MPALLDVKSFTSSKNQNPREGIETRTLTQHEHTVVFFRLQKTKIPARGLKPNAAGTVVIQTFFIASKNQNPREGIETNTTISGVAVSAWSRLQKTKIPARGLKPAAEPLNVAGVNVLPLQKTKIPARGLKPHIARNFDIPVNLLLQKTKIPARGLKHQRFPGSSRPSHTSTSKNQNPREGIETN